MSEITLSIANGGTGASKKRMSIEQIIAKNLTITDPHLYDGVFNAVMEAVEAEREACAEVCESLASDDDLPIEVEASSAGIIRDFVLCLAKTAIRARGKA